MTIIVDADLRLSSSRRSTSPKLINVLKVAELEPEDSVERRPLP